MDSEMRQRTIKNECPLKVVRRLTNDLIDWPKTRPVANICL